MQQSWLLKVDSRFSIGVYKRTPVFSVLCCKYWSNLHTVSKKKFCFGLKIIISFFYQKYQQFGRTGLPLFYHRLQCVLYYQLPVSICHPRCQISLSLFFFFVIGQSSFLFLIKHHVKVWMSAPRKCFFALFLLLGNAHGPSITGILLSIFKLGPKL